MLIDEPSIGLSPVLVQETFRILQDLRSKGMSILMVEQNARRALEISDFGIVVELGRTRMTGEARAILADPKVDSSSLAAGWRRPAGLFLRIQLRRLRRRNGGLV